jgi:hypothetical protein
MSKQLRQNISSPTHILGSDGAQPESNLGYATLAQLKTTLGLGASISTTNPVNGSLAVWQNGGLVVTDQTTTTTLTDGGNF